MSTIAREFTKEQLQQIIETDHVQCGEASALARIALASLEAEPVAWLLSGGGAKNNVSFDSGNAYADPLREVTPLYTAPPAPVSVPDEVTAEDCPAFVKYDVTDVDEAWARGFNACRAAMLQGANDSLTHEGKNHPEDKLGMTNIIPRYPVGTLVKLFPDGVATGTVMYVIMDEPPRYHVQWDDGTHSYPAQRDLKRVGTLYDGLD